MTDLEDAADSPRVSLSLGAVTELTLQRPECANALDWQTSIEFRSALARIAQHPGVRLVVLRGAGRHFCAGGDFTFLEENMRLPTEQVSARLLEFYRCFLGLLELEAPTLAVVHGSAVGAGLCLALACDLRIGSADARLGSNFARLGLHPGMGASILIPHAVGATRAAELFLTNPFTSGARAAELGLLTRAAAPQALEAEVRRWIDELAEAAPLALRQTVATQRAALLSRLEEALPREAMCQAQGFASADLREAVLAFRQRRKPAFSGR